MADIGHDLQAIGIAGYPERHPLIDDGGLVRALLDKQSFASYIVSQICFDPGTVIDWLDEIRSRGINLPLFVGMPGVVTRRRLMEVSLRIGVGESVRYLAKHGRLVSRLLRRGAYRPDVFAGLVPCAVRNESIAGLHFNTFNHVASTERWRRQSRDAYVQRFSQIWRRRHQ